ncbi:MAG: hypothetical protein RLZZ242_1419 [Bacteroidota bacterium]|jgi:tRNA threonylcarbamoyladenosine biosynthesis protein TsaB
MSSLILAFDTSTKGCSAALFRNGEVIAHRQVAEEGFVHAEQLHLLIDSLFQQTALRFSELDAIAVGAGPGSYTGLRIGVSAAKGYAFALDRPLIALDSLEVLAQPVLLALNENQSGRSLVLSAIDARRHEVFARIQYLDGKLIMDSCHLDIEHFEWEPLTQECHTLHLVGDASEKLATYFSTRLPRLTLFRLDGFPDAKHMGVLAEQRFQQKAFEVTETFEPNYLKEVYITPPKKTI